MTVSPMRPQLKGEVAKEKHTRNQWHSDQADKVIKVSQITAEVVFRKKDTFNDFSIELLK